MTDNVDSFQRFTDREQVSPAFPYPETLAVRRRLAPWILSRIREINRHGLGNLCAPGLASIGSGTYHNFKEIHSERKPVILAPATSLPSRRYQPSASHIRIRLLE